MLACPPPAVMSALRCFLVEDSPTIRAELIATLEEMLPLQVLGWADNEHDALEWLDQPEHQCDLILIDLFLKSGSGMGVLATAGKKGAAAKRVVLSNYATVDIRRRCLAMGADRVFDKSSEIDELVDYCRTIESSHS
ncbi:response regulator [Paucibacter sp. M5-1]|uniref:response regulator n=1 Tax=Paucibacter sp. M5-1 TaxID=3015998 RepID=UPI0022B938B2|nr:response regulator [Paucibacter sp. M5-1]MCZ7880655.1 response regulator [Paucibacter sp. M5-1]